ncbi:MAG: hypothetical protein L6R41_003116 [Letrouitia leprolyta]|nr:MAG: hypothetical protein L6R41_003116 [Letrouitia leprolyta]
MNLYLKVFFFLSLVECAFAVSELSSDSTSNLMKTLTVTATPSSSSAQNGGSGGPQFGPPPWVETAIEQYQASLHASNQSATSTIIRTSSVTAASLSTSMPSGASPLTVTVGATREASPALSTKAGSSSDNTIRNDILIVVGVTIGWLIVGVGLYYFIRRRRARRGKNPRADTNPRYGANLHEAGLKERQPELEDTQRLELKGSHQAERTELPI